ncbi:BNR-repeat neuraminidase N-terminal domain-containing protein [Parabacteroides sp.]
MKYILSILICCSSFFIASSQADNTNLALHLDGQDNNVKTGIGILKGSWTLETWIKGDDNSWKDLEVIFGGGEYSQINIVDYLPLVIEKGKLHNTWADLWSKDILDDQWHHVALSCDGFVTRLFLDGEVVDSKTTAVSVLPGAIGVNEGEPTTFGGLMDEVRIWGTALSTETLNEWKGKPLDPTHPQFKSLIAYYNFDDGIEDISTNWAGKGNLSFHLRNGRNKYKGTAPMAYTVINDNPNFIKPIKQQELFNAIVIDSEWDVDQGSPDDQILKLRIAVTGELAPLSLTELSLDLSEVTALSDISNLHIYYTGKTARSGIKTELFGQGKKPQKNLVFKDEQGAITLTPGINYILVTADIADKAKVGNKIKISIPSFKLGNNQYTPENSEGIIDKLITESSKNNPNIVKVLQWNIWHGGIHVGNDGLSRIIDLIKASKADIITMQEGYGGQQRIKESLGYHMQTHTLNDNLVLFSRYPITQVIPTKRTFFSNPVKLMLPGNRPLLVNACWLRYAYRPEYSWNYPNMGHNTSAWVAEDAMLGLTDAKDIVENDTKPYLDDNTPSIIGGDFNSCSHLDWTAAAAPLHYGYGPVPFPISHYMLDEGYKDSFREINPDEVARPEGTFAVIYGHLQVCRIDFLYYKGKNIKAVSSKIVKTAPEIDDVWASDHAAVMTIFEITPPAEY